MAEPELAFFDLKMNMTVAENFVAFIVSEVLAQNREELDFLERDI